MTLTAMILESTLALLFFAMLSLPQIMALPTTYVNTKNFPRNFY